MFVQNFINLSAVVHELSCWQSFDDAENTAVVSADSNNYNGGTTTPLHNYNQELVSKANNEHTTH